MTPTKPNSWSWQDDVLPWALLIVLFPIWFPVFIVWSITAWVIKRTYVWRPIDSAWAKCAERWKSRGCVVMEAPHVGPSLEHGLAVALGKAHRRNADFFMEKLHDSDPVLVGYAFKCLIRANPKLRIEDIPPEVLDRQDELRKVWADLGDREPVSDFIKGYFEEQNVWRCFREVRRKIGRGASPNDMTFQGDSAMHWAAAHGQVAILIRLLEAGADVNLKQAAHPHDPQIAPSATPLGCAIAAGHEDAVEFLIEEGADTAGPVWKGLSASEAARHLQQDEVIEVLNELGC